MMGARGGCGGEDGVRSNRAMLLNPVETVEFNRKDPKPFMQVIRIRKNDKLLRDGRPDLLTGDRLAKS